MGPIRKGTNGHHQHMKMAWVIGRVLEKIEQHSVGATELHGVINGHSSLMKCLMNNSSMEAPPAGHQQAIDATENKILPVSNRHHPHVEVHSEADNIFVIAT